MIKLKKQNHKLEKKGGDKLLIYFFQDSLTGSALSWYMRLDNAKVKKWKDLVEAFLK